MTPFNRTPLRVCASTGVAVPEEHFRYRDRHANRSCFAVAFDNVSQRARNGRYHETYCDHHDDVYTRHEILIDMEPAWVDDPNRFGLDVLLECGLPPTPRHSIDRINGLRGYRKGNMRWADHHEQAANRTSRELGEAP